MSRSKLEQEMNKLDMRAGLGGALTGLQHVNLIIGHFEESEIRLTAQGKVLLETINWPNKTLQRTAKRRR